MSAILSHNVATLLLIESGEKFRNAEDLAWANFRDDMRAIQNAGTIAVGEFSADVSDACMDLEEMFS